MNKSKSKKASISFFRKRGKVEYVLYVSDLINVSQGIYVFIIFVIKRSVITAIGKKKEIIKSKYSKYYEEWTTKDERISTKKRRGKLRQGLLQPGHITHSKNFKTQFF